MTDELRKQILAIANFLDVKLSHKVITIKKKSEYYDKYLGISIHNYNDKEIRVKLV